MPLIIAIVAVIIAILAVVIARNSVKAKEKAEATLKKTAEEKGGLKELKEASDRLKSTLEAVVPGSDPPCEKMRRELEDLKKRIEEAKILGGITGASSWLMERAVKNLQEEVNKLCPP